MSDHGYNAYTHGCRCTTCREAKAAYMREKRRKSRDLPRPAVDAETGRYVAPIDHHGTVHGYQQHCCRCLECTEARARVDNRRRAS